ncbi:MAG: RNA polymerase sigma factor [Pseudorhodoplanes sp.]|jgi:RNA polymerase sigma-70 factor (ECF subfamily)|nr:RNA polymerase sigma factor [Pseudorhodoplanes sp.]
MENVSVQPVRFADLRRLGDPELTRRARDRDEAAIRALMQRYNRRLFRIARGVLRNDAEAEDVVQEAYVRAFTRLAEFRGDSSFGTWISRIAYNEALGRLRRQRSMTDLSVLDHSKQADIIPFPSMTTATDPERTMAQREIQKLLESAIDDLPEDFRSVLISRAVEGLSIEETAIVLGIKPQTVKTRLHRARKLLHDALDRHLAPGLTDVFPFGGTRCERITERVLQRLRAS